MSYARIVPYYDEHFFFEVSVFDPEFSDLVLRVDKTWFDDKVTNKVLHAHLRDITLYDESGNQTQTLREVFKELVMQMRDQGLSEHNATINFEKPTFLELPSLDVPCCKILAISARIKIRETVQQIRGTNFVEWMLKNLHDGTLTHFHSTITKNTSVS